MPRPLRTIDPDSAYHIISRGNNKVQIFHSRDDYDIYLALLEQAKNDYGFSLFHYSLMPNHVHLLIRPNNYKLSELMHLIQLNYAKNYAKKYTHVGHVWQGRFKSLQIINDPYLFACGNYIEMNPVRAQLVQKPENWTWSSYNHYAFGEINPLVDSDPFYATLGFIPSQRQDAYRQLIDKTRQ